MKLYTITAWNQVGGNMGNYYVVAKGVNAAKRALREQEPAIKQLRCMDERLVIIAK